MRLQKQNRLTNPRSLRADDAAEYLGMGKTKFLQLVEKGIIPRAFTIDSIKIWDRFNLDALIDEAKEADQPTANNSFVRLYALIGRMRLVSARGVIVAAERIEANILENYLGPNRTLHELREVIRKDGMNFLTEFSEACREDLAARVR